MEQRRFLKIHMVFLLHVLCPVVFWCLQYLKGEKSEISDPRDENITRRESGKKEIAAADPVIKENSGDTIHGVTVAIF